MTRTRLVPALLVLWLSACSETTSSAPPAGVVRVTPHHLTGIAGTMLRSGNFAAPLAHRIRYAGPKKIHELSVVVQDAEGQEEARQVIATSAESDPAFDLVVHAAVDTVPRHSPGGEVPSPLGDRPFQAEQAARYGYPITVTFSTVDWQRNRA